MAARRFQFINAAFLLMLAMVACLMPGRAKTYSPVEKRLPEANPSATSELLASPAAMRSDSGINLAAGRDLHTTYSGETEITQLLEQNLAQPLALAAADFDE